MHDYGTVAARTPIITIGKVIVAGAANKINQSGLQFYPSFLLLSK